MPDAPTTQPLAGTMTLRQFYACHAMAAMIDAGQMLEDNAWRRLLRRLFGGRIAVCWGTPNVDAVAIRALAHADALLAAEFPITPAAGVPHV